MGFPVSSLRFKRVGARGVNDVDGAASFRWCTTPFIIAAQASAKSLRRAPASCTSSRLEDPTVSFADMLDAHRVLVGPKDRLGNIEQLQQLYADGFDGIVSFEPFAKEIHDLALPIAAVRASMTYVREALAAL